jgi:hypothetical protein
MKPFAVPPALRGVLLDFEWDRKRLFALELPVEEIAVAEQAWQLDLPWWKSGDRYFSITPNQVRNDRSSDHWRRTLAADLAFPIHVGPGLHILDGVHRLLKASWLGQAAIRACRLSSEHLAAIAVDE